MFKLILLCLVAVTVNYVVANEKIMICYYGTWATYRSGLGKFDVSHIDTSLCTHLVYTFVGINDQGTVISLDPYLDLPDNWGRDNFGKFNALKEKNPKLKTILAVGGWNEGSSKYSVMAADPTLRKNFIDSALKMVLDHGFDGLDVDWEYPNRRDTVHGQADVDNFTNLLKELRVEFDKHGLLLSVAVASVEEMASLSYDIPAISQSLDIISIMAYDMYGAWDPITGYNSPLHKGEGDGDTPAEELYTVDVALDFWIRAGCPPEKLVLGVPLYGRTFTLTNPSVNGPRAPASGPGLAGPYTATNGVIGYNEFCSKLLTEQWDVRFDNLAKVPYAVKDRNWVSFDNPSSLTAKVEYGLQKHDIAGVMVWSIETDDFHGVCGETFALLKNINRALNRDVSTSDTTTAKQETAAPNLTSSPNSFVCTEEGITANPEDCQSFYVCVRNANGELYPVPFKCPNELYFDRELLFCNYPHAVNCVV